MTRLKPLDLDCTCITLMDCIEYESAKFTKDVEEMRFIKKDTNHG